MKPLLRDIIPAEWPSLLADLGAPLYRGRQLCHWLYSRQAMAWADMQNLPLGLREQLAEIYDVSGLEVGERLVAADGTRKFLFRLRDGQLVESVIIPMEGHATFCISSQVGCAMACRFCATARGGKQRDLTGGEIVEQVQHLAADLRADPFPQHGGRGFNVVFMGMGEPLDNMAAVQRALVALTSRAGMGLSPRRIQISTSAPPSGLAHLDTLDIPVGLTISLGGADDASRRKLMPVSGRAGVAEVMNAAERYGKRTGQRVTLAWILIAGRTDGLDQAQRLAALAKGRPFKVNLIPLNELADDDLTAAASDRILAFQRVLIAAGVPAFVRVSGGQDIEAACGQLRRRRLAAGDGPPGDGTAGQPTS